ncbi:MAG: sel1 repeat family protein [Nitrospinota bacterium]|nr:sel1 repeat family protein [Nitrospinota bacterium]
MKQAFELFQKAANMGDSTGMFNLGYFYDLGIHVRKDKDLAIYWYKKALHNNDIAAANNIAIIHKEQKDWKKALWWFHKAAAQGDGDAFYQIAMIYHKGNGVKKNISKAKMYYRQTVGSFYVTEDTAEKAEKILKKLQKK